MIFVLRNKHVVVVVVIVEFVHVHCKSKKPTTQPFMSLSIKNAKVYQ